MKKAGHEAGKIPCAKKDGHPALNPAVDAGFRVLSFGVARAVSLPTGAAWRRGVCRFRGSACRGAPGLALRRQGHRGAPSVLDFFSGVRWFPSLNHALGAGSVAGSATPLVAPGYNLSLGR